MDTSGDSFYLLSPERRSQAAFLDAAAASSAAAADSGMQVLPYGPVPRGPPAGLGPTAANASVAPTGEGQPSTAFGVHFFESEAEKDSSESNLAQL
jgi:hypothetical protein